MKLIDKFNKLISKVGVDKLLHRLVGDKVTLIAILTAYVFSNGNKATLFYIDIAIGLFLLLISYIKEKVDSVEDYIDLAYAMGGWAIISVYFWIIYAIAR